MYESDGSIMVYWHALDTPETPTGVYILTVDLLWLLCKMKLKRNYYIYYITDKRVFIRTIHI